jgi:hypothetical protein
MPVTWETVRKIALALDKAEETTSYGTPAFKASGKLFVRQHQDGKSLVIAADFEQRQEMVAADPETYYITDHYTNYPWVLVSMSRVKPDALRDLLRGAHRFALAQKAARKTATGRKRR